jgi:RimJ/RimL family protein N-acetyltransferase
MEIKIKKLDIQEANKFLELLMMLDSETHFLMFEKNERCDDIKKCQQYLKKLFSHYASIIFIAENLSGEFVGHVTAEGYPMNKKNHMAKVSIGILKSHHGIGRMLLQKLTDHMDELNIKRLEAEIMTSNVLSLNLSQKFNFKIEGVKRSSVRVNDRFEDEYLIARIKE